ncbi:GNAT family N-acetyltransferase [Xanthomonas hyacinthi]|uniref:GNAT family N-acetyltransferase n=1 Tax=Xanthomonas hyacinthi TaxID=56455 RepID=UPI000AFE654A
MERARQNQLSGASRCFVVCDGQQHVVGYYALAAGVVAHEDAPGRIRRNMPNPVPVIVLGRLAVHVDWAGQGVGKGLLKDAVQRTLQACEQVGARALRCCVTPSMKQRRRSIPNTASSPRPSTT